MYQKTTTTKRDENFIGVVLCTGGEQEEPVSGCADSATEGTAERERHPCSG